MALTPNPVLQRLGYANEDRVVVIHIDDVGMCHGTVEALRRLAESGLTMSASVMAPCPWLPEIGAVCREHPTLDVGLHATFTSEWSGYRWAPLSTSDASSGLVDARGYFPTTVQELGDRAQLSAVTLELFAQIRRARLSGLKLSHVDWHMVMIDARPDIRKECVRVARAEGLIPFMYRGEAARRILHRSGPSSTSMGPRADEVVQLSRALEAEGVPLFDDLRWAPLNRAKDRLASYEKLFAELQPGLTHIACHPATASADLPAIAKNWEARVADLQVLLSAQFRDVLRHNGISLVNYRTLANLSAS